MVWDWFKKTFTPPKHMNCHLSDGQHVTITQNNDGTMSATSNGDSACQGRFAKVPEPNFAQALLGQRIGHLEYSDRGGSDINRQNRGYLGPHYIECRNAKTVLTQGTHTFNGSTWKSNTYTCKPKCKNYYVRDYGWTNNCGLKCERYKRVKNGRKICIKPGTCQEGCGPNY